MVAQAQAQAQAAVSRAAPLKEAMVAREVQVPMKAAGAQAGEGGGGGREWGANTERASLCIGGWTRGALAGSPVAILPWFPPARLFPHSFVPPLAILCPPAPYPSSLPALARRAQPASSTHLAAKITDTVGEGARGPCADHAACALRVACCTRVRCWTQQGMTRMARWCATWRQTGVVARTGSQAGGRAAPAFGALR